MPALAAEPDTAPHLPSAANPEPGLYKNALADPSGAWRRQLEATPLARP